MKNNKYSDLYKTYPIVFQQTNLPCTESCMSFGCECGIGWYEPINTLSARLEELNHIYKKYGLSIQYEQIKEKWGELTIYWNVYSLPTGICGFIYKILKGINNFINKHIRFKFDHIIDNPEHDREEWDEISKEDFDNKKEGWSRNDYGWKFKEEDGKYYRNCQVFVSAVWHKKLKNHKIIYHINNLIYKTSLLFLTDKENTKQECYREYLFSITEKYVNEATKDANNFCEYCGKRIGTRFSPRCTTSGWIKNLCEDCVKESGREYTKSVDK